MITVCIPHDKVACRGQARGSCDQTQMLVAAAMARQERGVMAPARMGLERDAPVAAPGAQSQADESSASWDLCGSIRYNVRVELERATEDSLRKALGADESMKIFQDVEVVNRLKSYIAACESILAMGSYVSIGTYFIEARRLMVGLKANALTILMNMSAPDAARARSSKLMKYAHRSESLAKDDAHRVEFDRAVKCIDVWVSENPAGSEANARDLQCPRCFNSDSVSFRARQDRAGDEGMTYYVVCRNCHTVTRI